MKPVTIIATILLLAGAAGTPAFAQPTADGKAANGPAGAGAGGGVDVKPRVPADKPNGETGAPPSTQAKEESGVTAKGTKIDPTAPANAMKSLPGGADSTPAHN
jgi:hypothetical protein